MSEPDKQLPASAVALRPLEDVTRGLLAVIEWRGNFARAGRESGIHPETLKTWAREMYPEQMQRLEREYAEEIERELVMEARENAKLAGRTVREGILRVQEHMVEGVEEDCPRCLGAGRLDDVDEDDPERERCKRCKGSGVLRRKMGGRELAQATYAMTKVMGTNVDKVLALTGRPTNGDHGRGGDLVALIRELAGSGAVSVKNMADVDADAVEK